MQNVFYPLRSLAQDARLIVNVTSQIKSKNRGSPNLIVGEFPSVIREF